MEHPDAPPLASSRLLPRRVTFGVLLLVIGVTAWVTGARWRTGQLGGMSANRTYVSRYTGEIAAAFSSLTFDPNYTGGLQVRGDWDGEAAAFKGRLAEFFRRRPLPDHPWVQTRGLTLTVDCQDGAFVGRYLVTDGGIRQATGTAEEH